MNRCSSSRFEWDQDITSSVVIILFKKCGEPYGRTWFSISYSIDTLQFDDLGGNNLKLALKNTFSVMSYYMWLTVNRTNYASVCSSFQFMGLRLAILFSIFPQNSCLIFLASYLTNNNILCIMLLFYFSKKPFYFLSYCIHGIC